MVFYPREISLKVARPSEGVLSWRLDDWGWLAGDVGLRLLVVAPRVRILHLLALALGLAKKKTKSCQRYLVLIGSQSHSGGNIHTRIEIPKTSSDQLLTVGGSIGQVSQIAIYRSEALISIQAIGATILKSQATCLKSLIKPIKTKPKKQFEAGSKVDNRLKYKSSLVFYFTMKFQGGGREQKFSHSTSGCKTNNRKTQII